ncbi:MAG: roadblock/LC7 domain-containing protein [Prosthecobacter sp.]|uniref:roadblock/LC7 domain-containing protein n=1 Tax=Prosthecobacter sp. TaxID=1965333 RepID=UPI003901DAB6
MNLELTALASLPGIQQAVIADDAGRLLDCAGEMEAPSAAVLVLAHATLAAASELGRRSGSGDCLEIIQQHEGGCIYLHSLPQHRLLLIRCQNADAIPLVRSVCQHLATLLETARPPASTASLDLASALHAEPAW